jgi:hypothetical protein
MSPKGKVKGKRGGLHANVDQMKMRAVWRTKAWKERTRQLLLETQRCEWCNGKSGVVNHRRQGYYEGYELCRREEVDIICKPCHQHWTKTGGQKRSRLYDDCASCEAPIFRGRKVCFQCGSREIISKLEVPEARKKLYSEILKDRCPEVRVGDVWHDVWGWKEPVEVTGFAVQDLPWPMVKTTLGEVGLPAFGFGKLEKRGDGPSWKD